MSHNEKSWSALLAHYNDVASKLHMRTLFEQDPGRFEKYSLKFGQPGSAILLDYSKNIVTDETMRLLFGLAREAKVESWRDQVPTSVEFLQPGATGLFFSLL